MMNSRIHGRRTSARGKEGGNGVSPSVLEILLKHLTDGIARSVLQRVRHGMDEVVRWTVLRMIVGWIGSAILAGGILLLFLAGVEGLEALHCPLWLAYLLIGVFAILVAIVAMKGLLWPNEKE